MLRFVYTTTKTRRFCVRLAGFVNLKCFSLEIKWPILTPKRHIFIVKWTLKDQLIWQLLWISFGNLGNFFNPASGHTAPVSVYRHTAVEISKNSHEKLTHFFVSHRIKLIFFKCFKLNVWKREESSGSLKLEPWSTGYGRRLWPQGCGFKSQHHEQYEQYEQFFTHIYCQKL